MTAARTEFTPDRTDTRGFYRLLTAVIVPRPIAWVSSTSPSGVDNLAPHSFFTVSCVDPAIVQFTSVGRKNTLNNVEASGEFVISLAPEPLFEDINATSTDYPPEISEFDAVGLAREASTLVKPPRVADSPVALECRLHSTLRLGDSVVVFGRVLLVAIADNALVEGRPNVRRLQPLARLGGSEWCTVGEVRKIARVPYQPPA